MRQPLEGRRGSDWPGVDGIPSGLPPPRRVRTRNDRHSGWDSGRGLGEERREGRRLGGPPPAEGGNVNSAMQEHRAPTKTSGDGVARGGWPGGGGGEYSSSRNQFDQQWEARGQQEYRYSGPGAQPGGSPVAVDGAGGGVGVAVVSTKASTMHNPVDPGEMAKIQAKKDSYRRDLEAQVSESDEEIAKTITTLTSSQWSISFESIPATLWIRTFILPLPHTKLRPLARLSKIKTPNLLCSHFL